MFRVYEGVETARVSEAVEGLNSLSEIPGILEWIVRLSDDRRKGTVIVQNSLFESPEALAAFAAHPLHRVSAERLRNMADWWIADYPE